MSKSSVLASFDPLAVHPFTNTSGLMPKPVAPSQYPMPLPKPATQAAPAPAPNTAATPTQAVYAPQPKHASASKGGAGSPSKGPIFVPFRPERSSPDLEDILLKKRVSDALAKKQAWSIDSAPVPAAAAAARKAAVRH